jgi:hypothetical protein
VAAQICVICTLMTAVDQAHIPGRMFFADPLPDNLITVPSCKGCNDGVKRAEAYLRVFLTALRGHTPGQAIEDVRARVMRQLNFQQGLRRHFLNNSELRPEVDEDGAVTQALHTRPDSARLSHVLSNYARGLHAWSTGMPAPPDALLSIERVFHMQTRAADYWEPMLAARDFAAAGVITTRGTGGEFRLAFWGAAGGRSIVGDGYGVLGVVRVRGLSLSTGGEPHQNRPAVLNSTCAIWCAFDPLSAARHRQQSGMEVGRESANFQFGNFNCRSIA